MLGLCAKTLQWLYAREQGDLLCILCPVLPATEGFYKYAFPGNIIVYSVRTKIYCNTNLYLTNCERARRVNSGPSRHFVTFKPRKSNFFRLQTKSLARHGAWQQDYDCIVIAVMYIRHASFLSFLLLQVPLISLL